MWERPVVLQFSSFSSFEREAYLSLPRKRESIGSGWMVFPTVSRLGVEVSTGRVFAMSAEKMDSRVRGNDGSQGLSIESQAIQESKACLRRYPLTLTLFLEAEGTHVRNPVYRKETARVGHTWELQAAETQRPCCRAGSLGVVVQHLAELLFGHAGGAQQHQDDFRLQGFGLGERRARSLADTRVDGRRVRDPHHRHSLALGKIGGDPGGEQPAKLRQRLLHRFAVPHAVMEGNRYDTDPPLALPGNGRQAVRGISDVNGDGVQGEGIGGRVFLREEHFRSQREVGYDGVNGIALHHAAGERGQVRPIAAGLGRRDDDGERRHVVGERGLCRFMVTIVPIGGITATERE